MRLIFCILLLVTPALAQEKELEINVKPFIQIPIDKETPYKSITTVPKLEEAPFSPSTGIYFLPTQVILGKKPVKIIVFCVKEDFTTDTYIANYVPKTVDPDDPNVPVVPTIGAVAFVKAQISKVNIPKDLRKQLFDEIGQNYKFLATQAKPANDPNLPPASIKTPKELVTATLRANDETVSQDNYAPHQKELMDNFFKPLSLFLQDAASKKSLVSMEDHVKMWQDIAKGCK